VIHARPSTICLALAFVACALTSGACGSGDGDDREPVTYFVRTSGNDGATGLTPAASFATIGTAINRAVAGDTIVVGPGLYVPTSAGSVAAVDFTAVTASAERPLLLRADPTGAATGDAPGPVVVDAQGTAFAMRLTGASGIIIDGFVISGARGNNAAGVQVRSSSIDNTLRNCEITLNDGDGVRIESSNRTVVLNNLIHANSVRGIQLSGGSSGTRNTHVVNNTIARNGNDGISIGSATVVATETFLRNNLIFDNAQRGIDAERGSTLGYDADYNLVFPVTRAGIAVAYGPLTPKGLNDLGVDPLFVAGFRLAQIEAGQNATSPAVDAGDPATLPAYLNLLRTRTTATDDRFDTGVIDIGFHDRSSNVVPPTATRTATMGTGATPTAPPLATPTPGAVGSPIFVRSTGDDVAAGTSPATALRTIQKAIDNTRPGGQIVVGPGTYPQALTISGSATSAAPILLRADPSGIETGDSPGSVVVAGGGSGAAIFVDGAQHWTIAGFSVTGASIGIHVRRDARGTVLRDNQIFANSDDAIRLQDTPEVTVFNNLIYCNGRRGILVAGSSSGSPNARIVNNTIVANADRGIFIGTATVASEDAYLRNNLLQDNCGNNIQVVATSLPGYDAQYNLVSPPSYVGAEVHPTDTAYDEGTGGTLQRPARFVERAFCEAVCNTPGRDPNERPTVPTIETHTNDFRQSQTIAGQDPPDSIAIDRGDPTLAMNFVTLLRQRTTATNAEADGGRIDIGFHFPRN